MAVSTQVIVPQQEIDRAIRRLDGVKNGAGKAVAGAMNDLMKSARTQIARLVTARVVLKYGRVLKQVKITRANPRNLTATLKVDGKARPGLLSYGAKDTHKRGVTYRISKTGGRKRIVNAFIAKGRARGNATTAGMADRVFRRQGKNRKPLVDLKGPSLNAVITKNEIDKTVSDVLRRELPRRIDARVNLLIERGLR